MVDDHAKLLPGSDAAEVASGTFEVLEFLLAELSAVGAAMDGGETSAWTPVPDGRLSPLVLHGHCQQKTLGWLPAAVKLLGSIPGMEVQVTSAECCGMAGSFGYKGDYYPISAELGRRLMTELDELAGAANQARGVQMTCGYLACGTSCRAQIADIGGCEARHPVELIDQRLTKR